MFYSYIAVSAVCIPQNEQFGFLVLVYLINTLRSVHSARVNLGTARSDLQTAV